MCVCPSNCWCGEDTGKRGCVYAFISVYVLRLIPWRYKFFFFSFSFLLEAHFFSFIFYQFLSIFFLPPFFFLLTSVFPPHFFYLRLSFNFYLRLTSSSSRFSFYLLLSFFLLLIFFIYFSLSFLFSFYVWVFS